MIEIAKKNLNLIILIVFLILLSNSLTFFKVDNISRKERRKYQKELDSLKLYNNFLLIRIRKEKDIQKELNIKNDSIILKYKTLIDKDKDLINRQKIEINKLKKLSDDQLLSKIDSLYEYKK